MPQWWRLSFQLAQCFLGKSDHPVCTSTRFPIICGYSGRRESYSLSPGADTGLAGGGSHIICQPDAEHSWRNSEDPVEAVEDSRIPPPLNPSGCLHTKYRTRESTDPSSKSRESLNLSAKGPLYKKRCSILQAGLLGFGFPQGNYCFSHVTGFWAVLVVKRFLSAGFRFGLPIMQENPKTKAAPSCCQKCSKWVKKDRKSRNGSAKLDSQVFSLGHCLCSLDHHNFQGLLSCSV